MIIINDLSEAQHFGPSWPEVAGFGEGIPQQAIFTFWPQGKMWKCI